MLTLNYSIIAFISQLSCSSVASVLCIETAMVLFHYFKCKIRGSEQEVAPVAVVVVVVVVVAVAALLVTNIPLIQHTAKPLY